MKFDVKIDTVGGEKVRGGVEESSRAFPSLKELGMRNTDMIDMNKIIRVFGNTNKFILGWDK